MIRGMFLVFVYIIAADPVLAQSKSSKGDRISLKLCDVAEHKITYIKEVKIPEEIKTLIKNYKSSWVDLCYKKGNISVGQTLTQALELENKFDRVISSITVTSPLGKIDWDLSQIVHKYLKQIMPQFVPAFEGSYIEYEFFKPSFKEFKKLSKFGTESDKKFFQIYESARGYSKLNPWYDQTWDYGGCVKFGQFDWLKVLNEIQALNKISDKSYIKIKKDLYAEVLTFFDDLTSSEEEEKSEVCVCKGKENFKKDIIKVQSYLQEKKIFKELDQHLTKIQENLENKKIVIKDNSKISCAGG